MKRMLFLLLAVGLIQLLLPHQVSAQSCCASKASCQKASSNVMKEKQDDMKSMSSVTSREVKSVVPVATASANTVISAFAINRLGEMVSKLTSTNCIAKGCDPAKCDVPACDPAKCVATNK